MAENEERDFDDIGVRMWAVEQAMNLAKSGAWSIDNVKEAASKIVEYVKNGDSSEIKA